MDKMIENTDDKSELLWTSVATWKTINRDLEYLIQKHGHALQDAVILARNLQVRLESIFPIMDDLCVAACRWCPDICCLTARVWMDFKDLLFLHFGGHPIPPQQLLSNFKQTCRYWCPRGCVLPRMSRPWVCTWYVCPTQKKILSQKKPNIQDQFNHVVRRIKTDRKKLETEFLRVVS